MITINNDYNNPYDEGNNITKIKNYRMNNKNNRSTNNVCGNKNK